MNLTNTDTGEVRKLEYDVRKLSGKAAMEAQINLAEYAKDKKRDEIVGSLMLQDHSCRHRASGRRSRAVS